jgi:hypothetical protein
MPIEPEFPLLDVPVATEIFPLVPSPPAFAVANRAFPLVVLELEPLTKDILPPVEPSATVDPANAEKDPPDAEFPLPTDIRMLPAAPDVAEPVNKFNSPELPLLEVPVNNDADPLVPAVPAFDVIIIMLPLEDDVDFPLVIDTRPPNAESESVV